MLKKELYLKLIVDGLSQLRSQVELLNTINLYDINIASEDFFAGLLNLIYGYHLSNLNDIEKNAPGIDLVDEKKQIMIQVTSDNSSSKIHHTISELYCSWEGKILCTFDYTDYRQQKEI